MSKTFYLIILKTTILFMLSWILAGCSFANRDAILKSPMDADTIHNAYIVSSEANENTYYNLIQPEDELAIADLQDISLLVRKETLRNDVRNENYALFKVNAEGHVALPLIGRIKVSGLNRQEAANLIELKYKEKELKNPLIDVRINNLYVVALGEVSKQGKYIINREDFELIDLLGEAGGLTPAANKRMVKIIRGNRSNPEIIKVNLESYAFLKNNDLRLRSRDIIYVEPKNSSTKAQNLQSYSTFFQIGFVALNTILLIVNLSK